MRGCTIQNDQLERLSRRLPNLEGAMIAGTDIIKSDVVEFIESSKNLTKLHLTVSNAIQMQHFDDEDIGKFKVTMHWDEASSVGTILFEAE